MFWNGNSTADREYIVPWEHATLGQVATKAESFFMNRHFQTTLLDVKVGPGLSNVG